jgi:hypothetical protein
MKANTVKLQYIYDKSGDKTFVVLPVNDYEELQEDLHGPSVIAERRKEPRLSWEEFEKGIKKDGLL